MNVGSSNKRLMPQPRHTRYELPCTLKGQLMFLCQQPRIITTAAPVTLAAITPAGQNHFNRLFRGFSAIAVRSCMVRTSMF